MIVRISSKDKPEKTRKALEKLATARRKKGRTLADFYGKLPGIFGNGLTYQKKVRDEWE
jgi:hypothetical protein